jgi:hypothetical protein
MSDTGRKDITDRKRWHPQFTKSVLLIPDTSQGSLKRSLPTLKSLPSTRPASLPAAHTTALLVLFSRATPSRPPRSCLMRLVPIPAQPRTLPALSQTLLRTPLALPSTAARAMPNKPLTLRALTPILPRTQPALIRAPPKTPPALLSTAARATLNKLPTLRAPMLTHPKTLLAPPKILARVTSNKPPTWLLVL